MIGQMMLFDNAFVKSIKYKQKIHTIRTDRLNIYRLGVELDFCTIAQKQNTVFESKKISSIQILYMTESTTEGLNVSIGGDHQLSLEEKITLAINDGFDDWKSFVAYFKPKVEFARYETYVAKLIHWTDKRY